MILITSVTMEDLGGKLSFVYHDTGEMVVDENLWPLLSENIKRFAWLHENWHLRLDSQNENLVNEHALKEYAAEGRDVLEVVMWMAEYLNRQDLIQRQQLEHLCKVAASLTQKNKNMVTTMEARVASINDIATNDLPALETGGWKPPFKGASPIEMQIGSQVSVNGEAPGTMNAIDPVRPDLYTHPTKAEIATMNPTKHTANETVLLGGTKTLTPTGANTGAAATANKLVEGAKKYKALIAIAILVIIVYMLSNNGK